MTALPLRLSKTPRQAGFLFALFLMGCQGREAVEPSASSGTASAPPQSATSGVASVGAPMPAYEARMLDGATFSIGAERGNVVFLNLWATWCGPCRYEIPELQTIHNRYAARRFKVVGVSVDEGEDAPAAVKDFVAQQKMTYPVVLDPDGKLGALFNTTVLPTSAIVDRTGKVVWMHFGMVSGSDQEMLTALEKALQG